MEDLNRFLRGWAAYFRYGNSAASASSKIRSYARMRLALFISKRHRRSRDVRLVGGAPTRPRTSSA